MAVVKQAKYLAYTFIVALFASTTLHSQPARPSFPEFIEIGMRSVSDVTILLEVMGWKVSEEDEESGYLNLETRTLKQSRSFMKLSWTRGLENSLESLRFVDGDQNLAFNLQARDWIRKNGAVLDSTYQRAVDIRPGAYEVIQLYTKTDGAHWLSLTLSKIYLKDRSLVGYTYEVSAMPFMPKK